MVGFCGCGVLLVFVSVVVFVDGFCLGGRLCCLIWCSLFAGNCGLLPWLAVYCGCCDFSVWICLDVQVWLVLLVGFLLCLILRCLMY